ncbi:hypothetical protein KSP39_PZI015669 [Platanthera zijinensis]|uniref:Surfeit locus protein 2 n=1 Tax=Platanthera zijinensis TaxID=2320716 RepID=A0AAP0B8Q2_9ASPA
MEMAVDRADESGNLSAVAGEVKVKISKVKEGDFLLGPPTFIDLGNGRLRCEETGHDLFAKDKESYARNKGCRLALIDTALAKKKPPLNTFKLHPHFMSKLVCSLTGDTINKSEEHIWKHINGKRFLKKLEEKEVEKLESQEIVNNKKARKKSKLTVFLIQENQNREVDESGSLARESPSESLDAEEAYFWAPPVGERWDFDDGKDRWEFCNTSNQEMEENNDVGSVHEKNEAESMKLSICGSTKRKAAALGLNNFAMRKKNTTKKKKKTRKT